MRPVAIGQRLADTLMLCYLDSIYLPIPHYLVGITILECQIEIGNLLGLAVFPRGVAPFGAG